MNTEQIEIVKQYLKIETNYAVLIHGQYGVGKTYFYKNHLAPAIEKTSLKESSKKFKPIHISLFGLRSLEEIQTAIFLELYPIMKNKGLKLTAGILKSLIRGISQIKHIGDIDKYIGDTKFQVGEWLKYDELVICFDDVDRKSNVLDLGEVFGFINSLVENQGAKILILANEKVLSEKKGIDAFLSEQKSEIDFSAIKEKVVGISIQFEPNIQKVYKEIITNRYSSSDKVYYDFLEHNDKRIIEVVQMNQNNLRNLIFFLEHFKEIFCGLHCIVEGDREFSVQKEEKWQVVLNFTLAIAFEYKLGFLNATNLKDIEQLGADEFYGYDFNPYIERNGNEKEEEPRSYVNIFINKYFGYNNLYFFKSIFDYLRGVKPFDAAVLKTEIDQYFNKKKKLEQDSVLDALQYLGCLNLTDSQYKKLTSQMLEFVDQGKYQLKQYLVAFRFALRFDNILRYNPQKLKERFKKGIYKGKANYEHEYSFDPSLYTKALKGFEVEFDEIMEYCIEINQELFQTGEKKKAQDLFDLLQRDFETFLENMSKQSNEYTYQPYWNFFDLKKTVRLIVGLENEKIWKLGNYFNTRYKSQAACQSLNVEQEFLLKLKESIDKPKKRKKKNLKNTSLDYLTNILSESVKRLSS